jgi:RecB family exonuclease
MPPAGADTEKKFQFRLDTGVTIRGRIDSYKVREPHEAAIVDYKYSTTVKSQEQEYERDLRVQAGIYALAALKQFDHTPASVELIGFRDGVERVTWAGAELLALADRSERRTNEAATAIHSGRIEVHPADAKKCRLCEVADVCRVEASQPAVTEASA